MKDNILQTARKWLINILMIIIGIAIPSIILIPLLSQFMVTGRDAFIDVDLGTVTFTIGDGDIFGAQYGTIAPPPNPDEMLSTHPLAWDSDGFRVPANPAEVYEIIALGDSFTEASGVGMPWSDVVAVETGRATRNLGYRGYGPQEAVIVMDEYGVAENPEVVVLGFFGGNDISNAGSYNVRQNDFVLPEIARNAITQVTTDERPWDTNRDSYQYPVMLDFGTHTEPVAFLNSFVTWSNVMPDDFYNSVNMAEIRASWQAIDALAGDACFIVTYFPSKPQIYLPYVVEEDQANIWDGQVQKGLDENGYLVNVPIEPTWDELLSRLQNVPTVLAQVAEEENIAFLDLMPAFQDVASNGVMLYPAYDTHWNQAGHDLAGAEIADFIAETCE